MLQRRRRHAGVLSFGKILDDAHAIRIRDSAHSQGAVTAASGKDYSNHAATVGLCGREEQAVDRRSGEIDLGPTVQPDDTWLLDGHVEVRWGDIHASNLYRRSCLGVRYR